MPATALAIKEPRISTSRSCWLDQRGSTSTENGRWLGNANAPTKHSSEATRCRDQNKKKMLRVKCYWQTKECSLSTMEMVTAVAAETGQSKSSSELGLMMYQAQVHDVVECCLTAEASKLPANETSCSSPPQPGCIA